MNNNSKSKNELKVLQNMIKVLEYKTSDTNHCMNHGIVTKFSELSILKHCCEFDNVWKCELFQN